MSSPIICVQLNFTMSNAQFSYSKSWLDILRLLSLPDMQIEHLKHQTSRTKTAVYKTKTSDPLLIYKMKTEDRRPQPNL